MTNLKYSGSDTLRESYCLARQPICNVKSDLAAYELLYRNNTQTTQAYVNCPNEATARVLTLAFMDIGIDNLAGSVPVFVNMTDKLLIKEDLLPEPADRIVLEVLEDTQPTPEVLSALKRWRAKGYKIALDDFVLTQKTKAFLPFADIIKLDIMSCSQATLEKRFNILKRLPNVTFLAEKVETWEEFEFCKSLGFDLFQGYFLSKPETLDNHAKSDNEIVKTQLLGEIYRDEPDIEALEKLISQDPQLYYRILKYVNSARYSLPNQIESLRHALTLLGLQQLRAIISMMSLAGSSKKGPTLLSIVLIRARMCQYIAQKREESDSDHYFTIGLLSLLDAFFQRPLDVILDELPLHSKIKDALLDNVGMGAEILNAVRAYEKGNWDYLDNTDFNRTLMAQAYIDAMIWSEEISSFTRTNGSSS